MSKYIGRLITTILFTLIISVLSGCASLTHNSITGNTYIHDDLTLNKYTSRTKNTTDYFATISSLSVYDDFSIAENMSKYDVFWEELKSEMKQIENDVSISVDSSDISRFNMLKYGESISISTNTANIIKIAKEAYETSKGLYDPTVYPLVDLWGFTPRFNKPAYKPAFPYDREKTENGMLLPDERYIASFTKLADFNKVILSGNEESGFTLTKNIEPVIIDGITYQAKIDLGGIAKGYAVDIVMEKLKENGYDYAYFSSGMSSIGLHKSASKKSVENRTFRYNLQLRRPRQGNTDNSSFMSVAIKDSRVSSSGDYDHSYEIDGAIFSHIINASAGYPMNTILEGPQKGITTVTILGDSATMCDAISTAICLMDLEDALDFVNSQKSNYKVVMVLYNSEYSYYEVLTNLDSEDYLIHDDAYRLTSVLDENGIINYTGTLLKD